MLLRGLFSELRASGYDSVPVRSGGTGPGLLGHRDGICRQIAEDNRRHGREQAAQAHRAARMRRKDYRFQGQVLESSGTSGAGAGAGVGGA